MVGIVLSSLALAAAVGCFVVTLLERKRSRERDAADMELWHKAGKMLDDRFRKQDAVWTGKLEETALRWDDQMKKQQAAWAAQAKWIKDHIKALEDGTVPDYERAKEAAKAVDDFHQGLANILNFDPYDAAKANREGDRG